jgi:hypothetical protein
MIGFFINYGVSKGMDATRAQYRLVQAIPLIPCGFAFMASFLLSDSPRWLASQDRGAEAMAILKRLRGNDATDEAQLETEAIQNQLAERAATLNGVRTLDVFKEIFLVSTYRKRFLLAIIMQTVAQWSGGNGITYYVPQVRASIPSNTTVFMADIFRSSRMLVYKAAT